MDRRTRRVLAVLVQRLGKPNQTTETVAVVETVDAVGDAEVNDPLPVDLGNSLDFAVIGRAQPSECHRGC